MNFIGESIIKTLIMEQFWITSFICSSFLDLLVRSASALIVSSSPYMVFPQYFLLIQLFQIFIVFNSLIKSFKSFSFFPTFSRQLFMRLSLFFDFSQLIMLMIFVQHSHVFAKSINVYFFIKCFFHYFQLKTNSFFIIYVFNCFALVSSSAFSSHSPTSISMSCHCKIWTPCFYCYLLLCITHTFRF